jgi:putative ABC transport system permease protein
MFRISLRGLRSHFLRLVATALAVILGVSFMVGTRVLGDTVKASFDEVFADVNQGVDAVVRSSDKVATPFGDLRVRIDAAVVDQLVGLPSVDDAAGQIRRPVTLVGNDGKAIGNPNAGPPTFGLNWTGTTELNTWEIVEGAAPERGTVVLDRSTASDNGISPGDQVSVLVATGAIEVTVAGIATFGGLDSFAGAPAVLFETTEAQILLAEPGRFDWITVAGEPGLSQDALVGALTPALPEGVDAITGAAFTVESAGPFREFIDAFTIFITAFGVIALFVGGFIIFNTFAVLVAQRMRELALLRALGASRNQVMVSVVGEAGAIGLVSSLAGALLGVGLAVALRALLSGLGLELPPRPLAMDAGAFVLPVVLGVTITMVSALVPAVRASRIAPVAAMGAAAVDTSARSRSRVALGLAGVVLGAALVAIGFQTTGGWAFVYIGGGLVVAFAVVTALGPVFMRPLAGIIGRPLAALTGITGQLATENARRNPARTSATTAALTIGIGLVTVIAIAASSASASVRAGTERTIVSDLIVTTDSFLGMSTSVATDVDALDEVAVATGIRLGFAEVEGEGEVVLGVDPVALDALVDLDEISGSLGSLGNDGIAIALDEQLEFGVGPGDQLQLAFAGGAARAFTVEVVFASTATFQGGGLLITQAAFDASVPESSRVDRQVLVNLASGVDPADGLAAVEEALVAYPVVQVRDVAGLADNQASQIDQGVSLLYGLLALSLVIALIGVVNTLLLSVYERTRELGLLRAVGSLRRQVSAMVVQEAVIIALVGTVLGLIIGTGFGMALFDVLARQQPTFSILSFPVRNLAVITVLGAVLGVLAGLYPAWRAGRLDVLDAISTD